MSGKIFEGVSTSGDLAEALEDAVAKAKESLQTTLVEWKLVSLGGTHGGFVQTREIRLVISASIPG